MWMYIPSHGEQQSEVEYELNQEMAPGMSFFWARKEGDNITRDIKPASTCVKVVSGQRRFLAADIFLNVLKDAAISA